LILVGFQQQRAGNAGPFLLSTGTHEWPSRCETKKLIWRVTVLYYALVFLVIALIAGVLGFGGIAGASAGIAQILFFLFLAFLLISVVVALIRRV
jgi:uncharacterized membrane protein YtjA (UPF0391 family)